MRATCFGWHALRLPDLSFECALCLTEEPIHFALLVPFSGSWKAHRIAGAATLAVQRINAKKALLPGRWLEYNWADSGCSAQQGLAAMGKLLQGTSRIDAVIGLGCRRALVICCHASTLCLMCARHLLDTRYAYVEPREAENPRTCEPEDPRTRELRTGNGKQRTENGEPEIPRT